MKQPYYVITANLLAFLDIVFYSKFPLKVDKMIQNNDWKTYHTLSNWMKFFTFLR